MATRTDLDTHDDKYFDFLFPIAYPNATEEIKSFIKENMIPKGDIAIESLLETAISVSNGIVKESSAGYDFLNKDGTPGGDAKKATAFLNRNRPRREAVVKDFGNKIGNLYICVFEPHLEQFYFFNVPYSRYKNSKSLSIYFEKDGTPRRRQLRYDYDPPLWKYEAKTIGDLYGLRLKNNQNLFEIA
jgi:hypothetical protein